MGRTKGALNKKKVNISNNKEERGDNKKKNKNKLPITTLANKYGIKGFTIAVDSDQDDDEIETQIEHNKEQQQQEENKTIKEVKVVHEWIECTDGYNADQDDYTTYNDYIHGKYGEFEYFNFKTGEYNIHQNLADPDCTCSSGEHTSDYYSSDDHSFNEDEFLYFHLSLKPLDKPLLKVSYKEHSYESDESGEGSSSSSSSYSSNSSKEEFKTTNTTKTPRRDNIIIHDKKLIDELYRSIRGCNHKNYCDENCRIYHCYRSDYKQSRRRHYHIPLKDRDPPYKNKYGRYVRECEGSRNLIRLESDSSEDAEEDEERPLTIPEELKGFKRYSRSYDNCYYTDPNGRWIEYKDRVGDTCFIRIGPNDELDYDHEKDITKKLSHCIPDILKTKINEANRTIKKQSMMIKRDNNNNKQVSDEFTNKKLEEEIIKIVTIRHSKYKRKINLFHVHNDDNNNKKKRKQSSSISTLKSILHNKDSTINHFKNSNASNLPFKRTKLDIMINASFIEERKHIKDTNRIIHNEKKKTQLHLMDDQDIREYLKKYTQYQDNAIDDITKELCKLLWDKSKTTKNIINILATGVPGTGKTSTVLSIRKLLQMEEGGIHESCFIHYDLNTWNQTSKSNLSGTGPGWIGFDSDNTLVDKLLNALTHIRTYEKQHHGYYINHDYNSSEVEDEEEYYNDDDRKEPPKVILLFLDEVCKVNNEILNGFVSFFESGKLEGNKSSKCKFTLPDDVSLLIYSAGNYGSKEFLLQSDNIRNNYDEAKNIVIQAMKEKPYYRDDCLIRKMGEIIPFFSINENDLITLIFNRIKDQFDQFTELKSIDKHLVITDDDLLSFITYSVKGKYRKELGVERSIKYIETELKNNQYKHNNAINLYFKKKRENGLLTRKDLYMKNREKIILSKKNDDELSSLIPKCTFHLLPYKENITIDKDSWCNEYPILIHDYNNDDIFDKNKNYDNMKNLNKSLEHKTPIALFKFSYGLIQFTHIHILSSFEYRQYYHHKQSPLINTNTNNKDEEYDDSYNNSITQTTDNESIYDDYNDDDIDEEWGDDDRMKISNKASDDLGISSLNYKDKWVCSMCSKTFTPVKKYGPVVKLTIFKRRCKHHIMSHHKNELKKMYA